MSFLKALVYFFPITLFSAGQLATQRVDAPQVVPKGSTLALETVLEAVRAGNPSVQEARALEANRAGYASGTLEAVVGADLHFPRVSGPSDGHRLR